MAASVIWYDRPQLLWADGAWSKILPLSVMPLEDKLNALMRLSVWFSVIAALLWRDLRLLVLVPVVAGVEAFAYQDLRKRSAGVEAYLDDRGLDVRGGRLCTKPTAGNPFMNRLMTDSPSRPAACSVSDVGVIERQNQLLLSGTPMAEDPYDMNGRAAARQFFTTASTSVVSDQAAFLKFVYGDMANSCKSGNGTRCYRNTPGMDARLAVA